MVFFFTTKDNDTGKEYSIYIGRDKYENEDLIKYSNPKDIWFHVNDLSSAHVYLKGFDSVNDIPACVVEDCAQLVKYNSIEGNRQSMLKVVYTESSNLKKENGYDVGQVSFHSTSLLRYTTVPKRDNVIINRLQKTKETKETISFIKDRQDELKQQRLQSKELTIKEEQMRKAEVKRRQEQERLRSYSSVFEDCSDGAASGELLSNRHGGKVDVKKWEDDFM